MCTPDVRLAWLLVPAPGSVFPYQGLWPRGWGCPTFLRTEPGRTSAFPSEARTQPPILSREGSSSPQSHPVHGLTAEGSGSFADSSARLSLTEHLLCAKSSERTANHGSLFWSLSPSPGLSPAVTLGTTGPGFRWSLRNQRSPVLPTLPHPASVALRSPDGSRTLQTPGQLTSPDGHSLSCPGTSFPRAEAGPVCT